MKKDLSWDDVLINPRFSMIESRADVNLEHEFLGGKITLPILNANMDTIASSKMVQAMTQYGGIGTLHRFGSIQDTINEYEMSVVGPIVSIGVGNNEFERALALYNKGATWFLIDVAHGASLSVVKQYDKVRSELKDVKIIVGNFANAKSIEDFNYHSKSSKKMDAAKVGIGGGSMCSTRIVTGCGRSTLASILDCRNLGIPIIGDGGFRTSGDICKSLAAGASAVMLGGMLAGTNETPGDVVDREGNKAMLANDKYYATPHTGRELFKIYRGSASKESYEAQGKIASHRTAEGVSTTVPYKGPVKDVLQQIEAGIRSSMSYVGASNYQEFRELAELVETSNATIIESRPHGLK